MIFNSFWAKFVVFPLKWHVLAEILDIFRNFKAENWKKVKKVKAEIWMNLRNFWA